MPFVLPLATHHDRKGFDCGNDALNQFLQRHARQNADRNLGVTHVVVGERSDTKILGYYTLVTSSVDPSLIPDKKLPREHIGVILLGRLATDRAAQGQGLGRQMLLRAIYQTANFAKSIGVYALTLQAIDEQARAWYLSLDFGFVPFSDDPNHLYVPIRYIEQLPPRTLTDEL